MKTIDIAQHRTDRRGFLKGMIAAGAAATGALALPSVSQAQARTLALQTNFAKGDILYEFGVDYTALVNRMTGGNFASMRSIQGRLRPARQRSTP